MIFTLITTTTAREQQGRCLTGQQSLFPRYTPPYSQQYCPFRLFDIQLKTMKIKKEILDLVTQVFEDPVVAEKWLTEPAFGLGGEIPIEYIGTPEGLAEVRNLLGRIE